MLLLQHERKEAVYRASGLTASSIVELTVLSAPPQIQLRIRGQIKHAELRQSTLDSLKVVSGTGRVDNARVKLLPPWWSK